MTLNNKWITLFLHLLGKELCTKNFVTYYFQIIASVSVNVRTVHIRRNRNYQQYPLIVQTLYSIYWLLHVSAVACNYQGAS
jgi:hypothetical protein